MRDKYKVGQTVQFKEGCEWDAKTGIITKIQPDPKGNYGSYLIENKDPFIIGWFNENQFEKIKN